VTDEEVSLIILWLAPSASIINQILRCDWLFKLARWRYLAHSGLPAESREKNFPESHIVNPFLSISYWSAVLWNTISTYYTDDFKQCYAKVRKDVFIKQLDFNATSVKRKTRT